MAQEEMQIMPPFLATLTKNGQFDIDEDFLKGRRPCLLHFGDFSVVVTKDAVKLAISEELSKIYNNGGKASITAFINPSNENEVNKITNNMDRVCEKFFPKPPVVL